MKAQRFNYFCTPVHFPSFSNIPVAILPLYQSLIFDSIIANIENLINNISKNLINIKYSNTIFKYFLK